MKSRALILLNAVGCLLLVALVVTQWLHERALQQDLEGRRLELAGVREDLQDERNRAFSLEKDVTMLKESLEQAGRSLKEAEQEKEALMAEVVGMRAKVLEANGRLQVWEASVLERDQRIEALQQELLETRQRLDEAVRRLQQGDPR